MHRSQTATTSPPALDGSLKGWDLRQGIFICGDVEKDLCQDNGLTFYTADGLEIKPKEFTPGGAPVYDVATAKRSCPLGIPLPYTVVVPGPARRTSPDALSTMSRYLCQTSGVEDRSTVRHTA